MEEIWKDIEGYEWLYQISSIGRVKSMSDRQWKIRTLKLIKNFTYSVVGLSINNLLVMKKVHRLVAQHFIPNPDNLPCVLHKLETLDERWMLYNWYNNLYWGTQKDNMIDKHNKWRANNYLQVNHTNNMLWKLWKEHPTSKQIKQYTLDWTFIKEWWSIIEIYRNIWIVNSNISQCCNWKRKTAGGFIWKFSLQNKN